MQLQSGGCLRSALRRAIPTRLTFRCAPKPSSTGMEFVRDIVGERMPEEQIAAALLHFHFDAAKALDWVLNHDSQPHARPSPLRHCELCKSMFCRRPNKALTSSCSHPQLSVPATVVLRSLVLHRKARLRFSSVTSPQVWERDDQAAINTLFSYIIAHPCAPPRFSPLFLSSSARPWRTTTWPSHCGWRPRAPWPHAYSRYGECSVPPLYTTSSPLLFCTALGRGATAPPPGLPSLARPDGVSGFLLSIPAARAFANLLHFFFLFWNEGRPPPAVPATSSTALHGELPTRVPRLSSFCPQE